MTIATSSTHTFGHIERIVTEASSRQTLFKDAAFRSALFGRIDELMPSDQAILSLDIFDTLLLRDDSSELERFIEIGDAMAKVLKGSPNNARKRTQSRKPTIPSRNAIDAFLARHLGTKASYRARDRVKGYGEGSLTEIHIVSSRLLVGDSRHKDAFINAELAYESTRIRPNALLLDYIDMHLGRGGKAILVTDMYMHTHQVERLLGLAGVDTSRFSAIISSADECISKASGLIFPLIQERMNLGANDFVHVGDSLKGDFQKPISHGWRALHLPITAAEIERRKSSHRSAAAMLEQNFAVDIDISMPS